MLLFGLIMIFVVLLGINHELKNIRIILSKMREHFSEKSDEKDD